MSAWENTYQWEELGSTELLFKAAYNIVADVSFAIHGAYTPRYVQQENIYTCSPQFTFSKKTKIFFL